MKFLLFASLFAAFGLTTAAQTASRAEEADAMKKAVEIITAAKKKPSVDIVLRDLREIDGKIIRIYDDSFVVEIKEKGKKRSITVISIGNIPRTPNPLVTVRYSDVLQIEGKGAVLSFVPDPKLTPYSEWDAIPTVGVGAKLQIHTRDGKKTHGVFTTWADDRIRLMQGNTQIEIARNDIIRIYQLAGDTRTMAAKVSEVQRKVGEVADGIQAIMSVAFVFVLHPALAIGIATAASAAVVLMYVLPKGGIKRILVFAQ